MVDLATYVMPLADIEKAVSEVRRTTERGVRVELLNQILRPTLDFATPEGKALAQRRALFVTRLGAEKLWP